MSTIPTLEVTKIISAQIKNTTNINKIIIQTVIREKNHNLEENKYRSKIIRQLRKIESRLKKDPNHKH